MRAKSVPGQASFSMVVSLKACQNHWVAECNHNSKPGHELKAMILNASNMSAFQLQSYEMDITIVKYELSKISVV